MVREDKFVQVDGLKTRYLEEGSGPVVILLHGASLGSSAQFPQIDLHIFDHCKHLVQWDVMDEFHNLSVKFLP